MSNARADRVAQQIQREISNLLLEGLKDPRIGMVTISRVQLTGDLRYARVFYSVYGDEEARAACHEGLVRASGFVRRHLAQSLTLRSVPEVTFVADTSLDHVEKMARLFAQIQPPPNDSPEAAKASTSDDSDDTDDSDDEADDADDEEDDAQDP